MSTGPTSAEEDRDARLAAQARWPGRVRALLSERTREVEAVARAAAGRPRGALQGWSVTALPPTDNPQSGGVYRVAGHLDDGGVRTAWSVVLKVVRSPTESGDPMDDPTHGNYWRREIELLASGLPGRLPPGLEPPRCHGWSELPEQAAWMWFEDLGDLGAAAWDEESFRAAARALGRFHAAFLCGRPVPDEPWLNNDYLPGFLAYARPSVDRLLRLARHGPTEYRGLLRGGDTSGVAAVVALVERPEPVLAALTRVPQVLCHLDTHVGNLVLCPDLHRGPEPRLVAIDWQLVGKGPLGADLAQLVSGTPSVPAASSTRDEPAAAQRESAVLEAYGEALAQAGATVDPAVVRFGHAACAVLRQGCWELFLLALDVHRRRRLPDADGPGAASERAEGTRRQVEEVVDRIERSRLPALAARVQDLLPMVQRAG